MDQKLRRHKPTRPFFLQASHLFAFKRIQAIGIRLKNIETIRLAYLLKAQTLIVNSMKFLRPH